MKRLALHSSKSIAIASALLFSSLALAQVADKNSANKKSDNWKWMDVVTFNLNAQSSLPNSTPENKKLAQEIWKEEIDSASSDAGGYKYPVIILMTSFKDDGVAYTFSILDTRMTISGCTPPGNGADMVDIFATCPLKVTAKELATGKTASQRFEDYCHLIFNTKDFPAPKNHTEIMIDKGKGMANFRVIQHGKIVPECNRSIKYKTGSR